ncbi:uncharacterized protein LOC110095518 [Dendrobium catenatum]|uniref:uncharacterized protein LOC110095518 n=1 Tax=Dendrobium catenatum TaxID=906689 RepID=UPI0009F19220|nr:uncharacterized protein LOC110095518 [Dendrobium catenatum]
MEEMVERLAGSSVFSKLDLRSGYHQIRIRPVTSGKQLLKQGKVFMNGSHNLEEHLNHLTEILKALRGNKLYLNTTKCEFATAMVSFLGFRISGEGISAEPAKVKAIRDWPTPVSFTDIRSFHGLANFYRRFIKGFSMLMALITDVLKMKKFMWGEEQQLSFENVKDALTSSSYRLSILFHRKGLKWLNY